MDLSVLLSDGSDASDIEPEPKRQKYKVSLSDAIDREIWDQRKNGFSGIALEIETHQDVIKQFLGPDIANFFENDKNKVSSKVTEYITSRIKETYDFSPFGRSNNLSREDCNWLSDHELPITRIIYRTFEPMDLSSKLYIKPSFIEIFYNILFALKENRFRENLKNRLQISYDVTSHFERLDVNTDRELREKTKKRILDESSQLSLTMETIEKLLKSVPLGTLNAAQRQFDEEPHNELRDDPENVVDTFNNEDISSELILNIRNNRNVEETFLHDNRNAILENHKTVLKGIMKTNTHYYSDEDVYEMDTRARKEYSKGYMRYKKKKVSFSPDPPQCRIVMVHCVENMINIHKEYMGLSTSLKYPVDFSQRGDSVGERYTAGFDVNYDDYRISFSPKIRATATTHLRKEKTPGSTQPLKLVPMRPSTSRNANQVIPAHDDLRELHPLPVIFQNALLIPYYLKLVRYGNFWRPHRYKTSSYNYCYGPMIISDALLEDVEPDYLMNTGLFAFPPPFTIKTVVAWLDEITPREFGIRDIVLTWGYQKLLEDDNYESAVGQLITSYQLIRKVIIMKFEKFWREGYSKLQLPRFWLITVPAVNSVEDKTMKYNEAVRCFCKMLDIKLIDWESALRKDEIHTNEHSANLQLVTLFKEMKEYIDVTTYTSKEQKILDSNSGLLYTNSASWKEGQRVRQLESQSFDLDVKPSFEQLRRMARG